MLLALVVAAPVVVWDSKVQDGYKRNHAPAVTEEDSGPGPKGCWDGRRTGGVVEELLKNSSDKAYGAPGQSPHPDTAPADLNLPYCSRVRQGIRFSFLILDMGQAN